MASFLRKLQDKWTNLLVSGSGPIIVSLSTKGSSTQSCAQPGKCFENVI